MVSLKFTQHISTFVPMQAEEKQIPPLRCASVGMTHSMGQLIDSGD
jgi:hypothetical protein